MSALVVVDKRRDGKLYPPGGVLPEPDRLRAIALVHALRCADGLSAF